MTWKLEQNEIKTYPRNPLKIVIVRVDFEPIDLINDQEKWDLFVAKTENIFSKPQDVQRDHYMVNLAESKLEHIVFQEKSFHVESKSLEMLLADNHMTIHSNDHVSHKDVNPIFCEYLKHLQDTYNVQISQLGVRYINRINRLEIESDLGKEVAWSNLIAPGLQQSVSGLLCDDEETETFTEIDDKTSTYGRLKLRYGYRNIESKRDFYLDFDRYIEALPGETIDNIPTLLDCFVREIYSSFCKTINQTLVDWMKEGEQ